MPEIGPGFTGNRNDRSRYVMFENVLFGKYELGRLLGCGAFAKVYHARNVRTGQSVAVKVISKKKIAGTSLMSNVKREITIMRRLRHPNIVRLLEVLASRTKIYFVMELVKGGELFAKVAKGRFSEDLARKYFRQLISAVGYCHARGVFHRDLKPENLLLDEHGNLKVSDFGLSAVKDQVRADGLLHTLCGTPAYVAPDILTKKGYDGAKVDVWSCGVILFVLTAGFLPFNDTNLMNMYKKIYKGEFRCPKYMSLELKTFLARLLDTNSNTRITIDEIAKDPWFRKGGYKEMNFFPETEVDDDCDLDDQLKSNNGDDEASSSNALNAFDLISFSVGLDLSGLVDASCSPMEDVERFLSKFPAEMIVEKLECLAKAANLRANKGKKDRVAVELMGHNGNFVVKIEIGQLTDELVVVEVMRKAGDASLFDELWKKKIRLELEDLVYRMDDQLLTAPPPPPPPPDVGIDDNEDDNDDGVRV